MSPLNEIFYPFPVLEEVGEDILKCQFLTPEGVRLLISCIESGGKWTSNYRDEEYFTQDLHLKSNFPDLYAVLEEHLENEIYPLAQEFWQVSPFEVLNMFVVRYTMDTQTSLRPHHDTSFITGSVKLNDEYEGALLNFPRKNYNNEDVDVGDLLLWPGNITHLHECKELTAGKKYALTVWTAECTN